MILCYLYWPSELWHKAPPKFGGHVQTKSSPGTWVQVPSFRQGLVTQADTLQWVPNQLSVQLQDRKMNWMRSEALLCLELTSKAYFIQYLVHEQTSHSIHRIYWHDSVWLRWGLTIISFPQACGESQATQPSVFWEHMQLGFKKLREQLRNSPGLQ